VDEGVPEAARCNWGEQGVTRRLAYALALAAVAAVPLGTSDFVAFVFTLGIIYGLLALSLSMLTGWVGQASLGHAAFVGAGAFTAGLLQEQGWPFWALFPAAVAVATPVSLLVGIPALRIRGLQLAVATLAFGWTVERAVFGQVFSSYWSGLAVHRPEVFGISFRRDRQYYLIVLAVAVLLTVFAANLRRRSSGRAFSAVRESESVFSHVGGSVASYKLLAFWLSTVYAAIAGVLYGGLLGPLNSGLFNLQFSLYLLAIAIVGGMNSLIGPYIAGMAFAWYPQLLSGIEALQYWTYLIGGISIIVFVVALPGGRAPHPQRRGQGLARRLRSLPVKAQPG
jgi:branched-chain amino acid transport system permease protein